MSISNTVVKIRPEKFTRITSVTTSSGSISNLDYNMTEILATANIAANESVTFNTTINTFSNVKAALSAIKVYDGSNEITNVGITPNITSSSYIKICDNNVCTLGYASKLVTITITNNTGSAINTNNFKVVLTFTPFYTITYNNSEIGDVLTGNTFNYPFTSNPPSSVNLVSGTCNTPYLDVINSVTTLVVGNVTSDIVLSSGNNNGITGGTGTSVDPYISTSNPYNPTVSDLPTGYISYTSADGSPQIKVENINGTNQITSFEFKDNTGVTYGSSSSLDTKFNAFVGDAFTINMTFDANLGSETGKYILSALEENNGVFNGFTIRVATSTSIIISTYVNVQKSNGTLTPTYSSSAARITKSNNIYTLQVSYDKYGYSQGQNKYARLYVTAGQTRDLYNNNSYSNRVPTSLTNATISINGNGIDNDNNMSSITVYTFKVTRT